ncbi:hypothetical protein BRADI_1g60725v3 [Brachypodium distachyon]|uniref:Uncharacterized protein n=1 Tax=Brachypodium distachyon TaxID=15368 RepID=A0A2K2DSN7_BRADI|nr:hypothetical protein BRADI_1g60725v3 [Brachypodium distachyon]
MEKKKTKKGRAPPVATSVSEEEGYSFAGMSSGELVNVWEGMIDENKEVAEELFFHVLLRDARAEYYPRARPTEPRPRQPPPQTDNRPIVLALCAPNSGAPWSTTNAMKPQLPRQPSSTATNKKPADQVALPRPQAAAFKTVKVLCAPPHLAPRGVKRPPPSGNACDPQGKKLHRAV